jgi:hypothetical protein
MPLPSHPRRGIAREERRIAVWFSLAIGVAGGVACATRSGDASPQGDAGAADAPDACAPRVVTTEPPDRCRDYVSLSCGVPDGVAPRAGGCIFPLEQCALLCPYPSFTYYCALATAACDDSGALPPGSDAGALVECALCPTSAGRAPPGLERRPRTRTSRSGGGGAGGPIGTYLARASELEAASVHAFRLLRTELVALGAPRELVAGARAAERDEARHALVMGRLARRFGGRYIRPVVRPTPRRSLEAIATDNAVEGCVRETFGALVATWQASHATEPELARALAGIAEDETRHAALSWAIARWMKSRLDGAERGRLELACRRAVDGLASRGAVAPPAVAAALGLPSPRVAARLVEQLRRHAWRELG